MKKKIVLPALLTALALSLALAGSALAGSWCGGPGPANLTPKQANQLQSLRTKFMNDTDSLRQQISVKRTELDNLWGAPTPDENQIRAKQQELNALRDKLQAQAVSYQVQARKISPNAGWGGGGGFCRRGGMGPGPCQDW